VDPISPTGNQALETTLRRGLNRLNETKVGTRLSHG
jgi:hypothetical protein